MPTSKRRHLLAAAIIVVGAYIALLVCTSIRFSHIRALTLEMLNGDEEVSQAAAAALREYHGRGAIRSVLNALDEGPYSDEEVEKVALVLAEMARSCPDELVSALETPPLIQSRLVSGEMPEAEFEKTLARFDNVRDCAATAMSRMDDPPLELLRAFVLRDDIQDMARAAAAWVLGAVRDEESIPVLIECLDLPPSMSWNGRDAAFDILARIGEPAVEPLIAALDTGEADRVKRILYILSMIGDPRAVEPVIDSLDHPDPDVRSVAAHILANFKDERAVAPLIRAAGDADEDVRFNVARSLGCLGGEGAFDALAGFLHDEAADVRTAAVEALANLGDTRAVALLLDTLHDVDVGHHAAVALAHFDTDEANEALQAVLKPTAYEDVRSRPRFYVEKADPADAWLVAIVLERTGDLSLAVEMYGCETMEYAFAAINWAETNGRERVFKAVEISAEDP